MLYVFVILILVLVSLLLAALLEKFESVLAKIFSKEIVFVFVFFGILIYISPEREKLQWLEILKSYF